MNSHLSRLLVRFYPRPWRKRYGAEFEAMLQTSPQNLQTSANVLFSALHERIFPTVGVPMDSQIYSFGRIVRKPSAFLPIAMSLTALTVVIVTLSVFGVDHQPADEGTAAHIWQLLMAGQVPLLAFFAIKWLPRAPRQTLCVLGLQAGACAASLAPVFFFHL
jgi:hypothetical protein